MGDNIDGVKGHTCIRKGAGTYGPFLWVSIGAHVSLNQDQWVELVSTGGKAVDYDILVYQHNDYK